MDDGKKELHSRRPFGTGRPPPADMAVRLVEGVSMKKLQAFYTVDYKTMRRWVHDPDVLREIAELRAEIRAVARAQLLKLTPLAIDSLEDVMRGGHAPARVKAADVVLRAVGVGGQEEEAPDGDEGSPEEQARLVLATAAMLLRDRGAVEAAALVEAERDRILPDSALNLITDGEVVDE